MDLTEELDKEWRKIMPLIGSLEKKLKEQAKEKGPSNVKPDDYDVLVRSLQFETDKAQVNNEKFCIQFLCIFFILNIMF